MGKVSAQQTVDQGLNIDQVQNKDYKALGIKQLSLKLLALWDQPSVLSLAH